MTTLLDSLRFRYVRTHSGQAQRNRRRRSRKAVLDFRPEWGLMALEDRTLLSSVQWMNQAGGDWDTGSNWSGGFVPGASDDVTIDVSPGITVTHSQNDPDSVNSLTVSSADTLSISNGSLSIASPLDDRRLVQPDGRDPGRRHRAH